MLCISTIYRSKELVLFGICKISYNISIACYDHLLLFYLAFDLVPFQHILAHAPSNNGFAQFEPALRNHFANVGLIQCSLYDGLVEILNALAGSRADGLETFHGVVK